VRNEEREIMAKKEKVKGSYCWCDEVRTLGEKQALGYNCTCHIKGKKGIHTGTHISLQQRGK